MHRYFGYCPLNNRLITASNGLILIVIISGLCSGTFGTFAIKNVEFSPPSPIVSGAQTAHLWFFSVGHFCARIMLRSIGIVNSCSP